MTRALVLGRRRRGRPIGEAVAEAARQLQDAGWSVESKLVDRKRQLRRATRHAVKAGVDVVVAVGGDGAVLQVVQKVAETKVALGIVPMGTGNLLATNLGIPKSPDAAVQVLLGQRQRVIDVGQLEVGRKRKVFTVACGVGFDAEVMDATPRSSKNRLGKLAYFASVVGQRDKLGNVRHEITIDGKTQAGPATQVFVANFGGMGFGFEPRLEVKPDDGLLDVLIVSAAGPVDGLLAGWEAIRQQRRGRSSGGRVFRARGREVRIEAEGRRLVEIDGSVVGRTPVSVTIRPAALAVLVPSD
jgi:YegS/Rv2252/BmrU family lipid kinase